MVKLISINAFFAFVMFIFIALPVTSNWLWLGLIFTWCWAEGVIAQNTAVKWWHMLAIFVVLGAIEAYLLMFVGIN